MTQYRVVLISSNKLILLSDLWMSRPQLTSKTIVSYGSARVEDLCKEVVKDNVENA
jgi:hypothetical protein